MRSQILSVYVYHQSSESNEYNCIHPCMHTCILTYSMLFLIPISFIYKVLLQFMVFLKIIIMIKNLRTAYEDAMLSWVDAHDDITLMSLVQSRCSVSWSCSILRSSVLYQEFEVLSIINSKIMLSRIRFCQGLILTSYSPLM